MTTGSRRLDWNDPAAVRAWMVDLRVCFDDADAVTDDMLRPRRERDLGARKHRVLYGEAAKKLRQMLDFAMPEPPDGDGGADSGGTGRVNGADPVN